MRHNVRRYLKNSSNEKLQKIINGVSYSLGAVRAIMTDSELHNQIEAQFNAATLHKENVSMSALAVQIMSTDFVILGSAFHS
jgi:formate/nitrite transporter FocA (FNT family)